MSTDSFDEELRALPQSVYEQRVSCSVEGVLFVVMGSLVIAILSLVTVAVTSFLGWLFLVSGIVGLVTTFWARLVPGFCWSLLSATLVIAVGIILLEWAVPGAISLTLLLIVFFIIEGVLSIMYALEHKRALSDRWGWMLVSGIIGFILAAVIWAGLPGAVKWVLGLLVGINMLCRGSAKIAMAKCMARPCVQDGLPRSTNTSAASMYQASEVEQFAPGRHGYPRASETA
jgi:uncharacterized membrane protein HdeD (DUF308 family)